LVRNCARIWRIGPVYFAQVNEENAPINPRNRDARRVHSEPKNLQRRKRSDATPTPKPKPRKKKSGAKKTSDKQRKVQIDVGHEKRKSPATKNAGAASRRRARRVREPQAAATGDAVPTPAPSPQPKPARAVSAGAQLRCDRKSGIEEDRVSTSAIAPPRRYGSGVESPVSYRYLTSSVVERSGARAVETASLAVHCRAQQWHAAGHARVFDYYHKHFRRMQNGSLITSFIGNGTSPGNGQIEVAIRWRRQINGGHVHSDI